MQRFANSYPALIQPLSNPYPGFIQPSSSYPTLQPLCTRNHPFMQRFASSYLTLAQPLLSCTANHISD